MPVARIISSSFEDALRFADYLRPIYDTVEIAQPGRASDTAVDLEVNLELCTPEEAWQQITQLSRQPDSEIFVAPGIPFPAVQDAQHAGPEMGIPFPAEAAATPQEYDIAGRAVDAAMAQATAAAITAAGSNGSGIHKAHSAAIPDGELTWLGRARESVRQWRAIRALLRDIRQMKQEELAQEQKRQRQMALQFERERREQEARRLAAARASEQELASFLGTEQDLGPELQVPLIEKQPLPRQLDAEELRRKAEQEEAVRRGLFVEEILRRRAAEQAEQAMQAADAGSLEADAVPVDFQFVAAEAFAAPQPAPMIRFSARQRSDRLRPAMAMAGVTSVLLMAGLVGYAHRRPASPVPLSVLERSDAVEQKVPFGPVVLPAASPAVPVMQASEQPLQDSAPLPERHNFRSDFRRVRVDRHEVDYVADDVTVRHFNNSSRASGTRHPAAAVPISASTRGVKQISDME